VRIYKQVRILSLQLLLELLTPTHAGRTPKRAGSGIASPATLTETVRELLPELTAFLIVLIALSAPVLLILWRLRHSFEGIRLP